MEQFRFPANIKQIGSIDKGLKIYVEDYVYSYLNQLAKASGYDEQLAILMGKYLVIDGQEVLFISGTIQGKHTESINGILNFTDKSWEYVLEERELYFSGLDIVGWMQSQPSYGTYLNSSYANYHLNNFRKPYQVLFVCDPIEKTNAFYAYNKSQDDLEELSGYFIYFEKNKEMHEYMVSNKLVKQTPKPVKDPALKFLKEKKEKEDIEPVTFLSSKIDDTKEISLPSKTVQNMEKKYGEQKKVLNLLVGLCGVLFLTSFVMGMGLMQNQDRIAELETHQEKILNSYKTLLSNSEKAVFASQENPLETSEKDKNIVAKEEIPDDRVSSKVIVEDGNEVLAQSAPEEKNLLEDTKEEISEPEETTEDKNVNSEDTKEEKNEDEESDSEISKKIDVPEYYVVEKGDTLSYISLKFYGTKSMSKEIMKLNNIDNANKIIIGKKIKLPRPN